MTPERIEPRWSGLAIVAGSGPTLTSQVADLCRGHHLIVVNDAYRLMPWADVLYACDARWWRHHEGCRNFVGEKWTSYHEGRRAHVADIARCYKLHVCLGAKKSSFSLDPALIHYGMNSGFQAINLAILFGANPIILVGFDFRPVGGKKHFFGDHPRAVANGSDYRAWIITMRQAAKELPKHLTIINCTQGSAIKCFPMGNLKEVLDGAHISHAA